MVDRVGGIGSRDDFIVREKDKHRQQSKQRQPYRGEVIIMSRIKCHLLALVNLNLIIVIGFLCVHLTHDVLTVIIEPSSGFYMLGGFAGFTWVMIAGRLLGDIWLNELLAISDREWHEFIRDREQRGLSPVVLKDGTIGFIGKNNERS